MIQIIYLISLFLLGHTYFFYPLSIWFLNLIIRKNYLIDDNCRHEVSIVISVFNEEKVIEKTIRNFLLSDYDINKIEFVIGSDHSTDSTNEIIRRLQKEIPNFKFFEYSERRGKAQVLNDLVREASSEILIFSDANTKYYSDAISNLVKYYADQNVGGVSGKLILIEEDNESNSEGEEIKYWNFETWLKEKEGALGKLVGANGGIYSIRKSLFIPIPKDHPIVDDFFLSLKVLEQKKNFLYTSEAKAEEVTAPSILAEFKRKMRGNANNFSTIRFIKRLLNPGFGMIAYSLWSHKIIRWFTPLLLILLFISNYDLVSVGNFYKFFFIFQLVFYAAGLLGFLTYKFKTKIQPLNLIFYFLMTNTAMLFGLVQFLFKKNTAFWQSTPRENAK